MTMTTDEPQRSDQRPWRDPARWPAALEGPVATLLRAVGSLLVAISGDEQPQRESRDSTTGARTAPTTEQTMMDPSEPRPSTASSQPPAAPGDARSEAAEGGETSEVSMILADARARAQRIIDESVVQAEALLQQQAGATMGESGVTQLLDRLRRMVADLAAEVRALHGRLDSIDSLLRSRGPAAPPREPQPAAGSRPETPAAVEPIAPAASPPVPPPPAAASPSPVERAAVAPPLRPQAPPPPAPPLPPPHEDSHEERPAVDWSARAEPPQDPATSAVEPNGSPAETEAESVTAESFSPDGGSVLLRVSPVSGFQGLMRVQDTLVRLRAVREASVEAYSQGEARLRVQLSEPMKPDELAAALGEGLAQEARVEASSLPERSLLVALG